MKCVASHQHSYNNFKIKIVVFTQLITLNNYIVVLHL